MRKFVLFLVFLAFAICSLSEGLALQAYDVAYVSNPDPTDRLNLRAAPRQDSVSLGKYYSGTEVTVLDAPQAGWVHVRIAPMEGYVDANFLVTDARLATDARPVLTVKNSSGTGANVRSEPSMDSDVLCTALNGASITVLAVRDDDWLHVITSGVAGFVRADLLTPQLSYHKGEGGTAISGVAYVSNPDPTDRLHLRVRPDASSSSMGKYYNGTQVSVLGDAGGGYTHVRIGALEGYMDASFLSSSSVASAKPVLTVSNTTGANIRSTPSTASTLITTLGYHTPVTVLAVRDDGWLHVEYGDLSGFVLAKLLSPQLSYDKDGSTPSVSTIAYVNNPDPTDRLHLRVRPDASSSSMGKYYNGTQVSVVDDAGGGYVYVCIGALSGYMDASFLSSSSVPSAKPVLTVSNATGANLRSSPSVFSSLEAVLDDKTSVTVLAVREDGWLHVEVGGISGFVLADLLSPQLSYDKE